MFNPFFNPYRVRRIDQGGIPMPNVPAPMK